MKSLFSDIHHVKEKDDYYVNLNKFRLNFTPGVIRPKTLHNNQRKETKDNQIDLNIPSNENELDFKILTSKDRYNAHKAKSKSIYNGNNISKDNKIIT